MHHSVAPKCRYRAGQPVIITRIDVRSPSPATSVCGKALAEGYLRRGISRRHPTPPPASSRRAAETVGPLVPVGREQVRVDGPSRRRTSARATRSRPRPARRSPSRYSRTYGAGRGSRTTLIARALTSRATPLLMDACSHASRRPLTGRRCSCWRLDRARLFVPVTWVAGAPWFPSGHRYVRVTGGGPA